MICNFIFIDLFIFIMCDFNVQVKLIFFYLLCMYLFVEVVYFILLNYFVFSMNNSNQNKILMRICNGEVRRFFIVLYFLMIRVILDKNIEFVSYMNLLLIMVLILVLSYKDFNL